MTLTLTRASKSPSSSSPAAPASSSAASSTAPGSPIQRCRNSPCRDHISVPKVCEYKRGTAGYNGARIRKTFTLIQDVRERKRGRG